ncbi:hypothetical protein IFM89_021489 [Coptis chinensis]|uniref:Uncharacterized protein n=1 Tax=Coptis chinensis TaxID=261450 RepID=A0A835LG02_9MAGN|nr:hypothetical protein IFM89_021489 [Coptis chinensis]
MRVLLALGATSSTSDLTTEEAAMEAESISADNEKTKLASENANAELEQPNSRPSLSFRQKLTNLEVPRRIELYKGLDNSGLSIRACNKPYPEELQTDGYETAEDAFDTEEDEDYLNQFKERYEIISTRKAVVLQMDNRSRVVIGLFFDYLVDKLWQAKNKSMWIRAG